MVLVIPKKEIPYGYRMSNRRMLLLWGHLLCQIPQITKSLGIDEKGYRVIVNCKEHGGQEVPHLHFHILGGRTLSTPIVN